MRVKHVEAGLRPLLAATAQVHSGRGTARVLRAVSCADAVLTSLADERPIDQIPLSGKAGLVFALSDGQGATVDGRPAVLQACFHGVVVEACRESARRDYVSMGKAVPDALKTPVCVLLMPAKWGDASCRVAAAAGRASRVYVFEWSDHGVSYWRSPALTVTQALDHALSRIA